MILDCGSSMASAAHRARSCGFGDWVEGSEVHTPALYGCAAQYISSPRLAETDGN